MTYDFEDCLRFVKQELRLHLFPYQEVMLKAFCEGQEVRTARNIGRTYVANAFGKYVASLYDKNDYDKVPDIVFPFPCALRVGAISTDFIDEQERLLSEEDFAREYLCE